jgi:hypothetical protein
MAARQTPNVFNTTAVNRNIAKTDSYQILNDKTTAI